MISRFALIASLAMALLSGCTGVDSERTARPAAPGATVTQPGGAPSLMPSPGTTPLPGVTAPVTAATSVATTALSATLPALATREVPDLGIRIALPASWASGRIPGAYLAGPDPNRVQLAFGIILSIQWDAPPELDEMRAAMVEMWNSQHAPEFTTSEIVVGGFAGVAFWHLPNTCVSVYVPAHQVVRKIALSSQLCAPSGDRLTPLGEAILASVVLQPPVNPERPIGEGP